jgi:hypothetical protein
MNRRQQQRGGRDDSLRGRIAGAQGTVNLQSMGLGVAEANEIADALYAEVRVAPVPGGTTHRLIKRHRPGNGDWWWIIELPMQALCRIHTHFLGLTRFWPDRASFKCGACLT